MHIVDRRLNPSGKNLANRQRFMRRAKSLIRKAVHESSASRSIKDADQAGEVALPAQGVHEPSFHRSTGGGIRDHLLPGNKQYVEGSRNGLDPLDLAALVLGAIEENEFYIVTQPNRRRDVEARYEELLDAFDAAAARLPRILKAG